ncbi:MAG: hypothetical protein VR70_18305 [Rhodospirillaceae bacterium BRH_c57]|nr:MAG: hypothetical protein VR70_18305 [Rhodospirillaceae bacterium BRH_c57]
MGYVKDWTKLKATFAESNKVAKKELLTVKNQLQKFQKKGSPDLEEIEDLEYELSLIVHVKKKKTGVTPVLRVYEKIIPEMEKMIKKKVSARNEKAWKPYIKKLGKAKTDTNKAVAFVKKQYMEVKSLDRSYGIQCKKSKALPRQAYKRMVGKTVAASMLTSGLDDILIDVNNRIDAIAYYMRS